MRRSWGAGSEEINYWALRRTWREGGSNLEACLRVFFVEQNGGGVCGFGSEEVGLISWKLELELLWTWSFRSGERCLMRERGRDTDWGIAVWEVFGVCR